MQTHELFERRLVQPIKLFGMGFSRGGFESLIIPFDCNEYRAATK
jgi:cysteine-S-conjugate beta-lyase